MKQRVTAAVLMLLMFSGVCVLENDAVRAKPAEQVQQQNVSSIYMLAGQFRTVFANLLWLKVDNYHHEYIEHDGDWRQNKELIGLLDMVVMLDPQFEEAYAIKSCIYADGYRDIDKAITCLRQGISLNPKSRELRELLAIIYARRLNDPDHALPYARQAVKLAEDDWYRKRASRLEHTLERMIREREAEQNSTKSRTQTPNR